MLHFKRAFTAVALSWWASGGLVAAQGAPAVVKGFVSDSTLRPIANVSVTVAGTAIAAETDTAGAFVLRISATGERVLILKRIGLSPLSYRVDLRPADTTSLSFEMVRLASTLDTVRVVGAHAQSRRDEILERIALKQGQFLTMDQIERRGVVATQDLFHSFLGVTMSSGYPMNRRAASRGCQMQLFLDDVAMPIGFPIDRWMPAPGEIFAIETYVSAGTIPPRYKTFNGGGFCGVILVWTKSGPVR